MWSSLAAASHCLTRGAGSRGARPTNCSANSMASPKVPPRSRWINASISPPVPTSWSCHTPALGPAIATASEPFRPKRSSRLPDIERFGSPSRAVAIGGTSVNENLESTPLAEDGFLYVVDQWGVLYKIDARTGDVGRIVWRMDPKQEKAPDANRGAALWCNVVITAANFPPRIIATEKDTGKRSWAS